jgi:Bacteriophage Mu Gp45 spike protein
MVSRASPFEASYRAYHSGGTRSVIEQADDSKLMQEHSGSFSKGEARKGVESPQNYGFTSVVHKADKDENGNVTMGAEGYVTFQGGNRSFPMYGAIDDRRHRLKELKEGDSAMYRGKDDRQQFHLADDGNYMTARSDRRQRIALVPPPEDDKQQQQQPSRSSGGTGGEQKSDSKEKKKPTGQKSALDDNKKSEIYYDQSGSESVNRHGQAHSSQRPSDSTTYYGDRKKSTQTTEDHTHLRTMDFRIFTDKEGCWAEVPIQVKKDRYCKD